MAFLDLAEGIAELFSEGNEAIVRRRTESDARYWFLQNRMGRHQYRSPIPPLAAEVSCVQCHAPLSCARSLGVHIWQAHVVSRQRVVTCCVCRESFGGSETFRDHYASRHPEANLAAARISYRMGRARRAA